MDPVQDQKNQTGQNQPNIPSADQEAPPPPPPMEPGVPTPEPPPAPPTPEPAPPTPEPPIPPPGEEQKTESLPPVISPPEKKKGLPISMFGIVALLFLVISIPVGVFLVKQTQELRSRAYEAADCEQYGGLADITPNPTKDCDVNTNQLVQAFVCNNPCPEITGNETENCRLPGAETGQACPQAPRPPQEPAPTPIPSDQDADRNLGGGCCDPGAADNSPRGCRRGGGFNEACDISNGACASGFSCRSLPGTGCEQNTDCGPGNECRDGTCRPIPTPSGQYTSCASWGWSDDPDNTANPNCEREPINGFSCRRTDGVAVCAYRDGTWQEGQQGNCEDLRNGTIRLNATAELVEYHCTTQTSSTGSCSENRTVRGQGGPGEYTVTASGGNNCGGHQIDATGYCGSYVFRGACQPQGQPALQCTAVKFYDANWNLIANPQTIRAGQTVRVAVVGSAQIRSAEFRVNGGGWEAATGTKPGSSEFYIEKTLRAGDGGRFSVEARVY